ncbi:MAG: universal stress protein [Alphaproteobacteria bacterium]
MEIRTLLVPLGSAAADRIALGDALAVARRLNAHVRAVLVDPSQAPHSLRYGQAGEGFMTDAMLASLRGVAQQYRDAGRALTEEMAAAAGVPLRDVPDMEGPSVSWGILKGDAVGAVVGEAAVHDLVVLPAPSGQPGGGASADVDGVLLATGRPTLFATGTGAACATALVGWNCSPQAGRALSRALPLLREASRVHLLQIETGSKAGPDVDRAALYLASHGISAETHRVPGASASVGELLLQHADDLRADLLVMGAYSHNRLRELLLGGVTRHVLAHARVPTLMVH